MFSFHKKFAEGKRQMANKKTLCVIVVLANDAVYENGTYVAVGPNFKLRMRMGLHEAWNRNVRSDVDVCLAFAAGTDAAHQSGPTLASVCVAYAKTLHPGLPMLVNKKDHCVFGTYGEIKWVVERLESKAAEYTHVQYVFVSQPRHLRRIRTIVRWFAPDITAEFVASDQTKEIPLWNECLAYLKLILLKLGFDRVETWRRNSSLPF